MTYNFSCLVETEGLSQGTGCQVHYGHHWY